jgi:enamine deaminase RidA (YjgF/YER057c/UK114 family)
VVTLNGAANVKREVIRPWPAAPEHRIPFVPAIKISGGTLLFISGMGALPPIHRHPHVAEEWVLPEDAAEQARRTFNKIRAIVEKAGGSFKDIVKITRYMKDIADQDKVNEVVYEYFGDGLPCSTTVQVSAFVVPTMKLEIDAWAVIPDAKPAKRGPAKKAPARKAAASRAGKSTSAKRSGRRR